MVASSSHSLSLVDTAPLRLPARDHTVRRQRLLDRLEAGSDSRLTLLSAPAGFGKTTLLRDWFSSRNHCLAWVALTSDDREPGRFWLHIIQALQAASSGAPPNDAPPSPAYAAESTEISAIAAIRQLCTEHGSMVLALDNFQVIDSPAILASVFTLIEHVPPAVRLIIATRTDPELPLSRLRGQGNLAELRGHDLRFTIEESTEFLIGRMGLDLQPRDVEVLHVRTEGWIAGLQLAATTIGDSETPSAVAAQFGGSHPHVLDYFDDEVLSSLPADVCDFLIHSSICHTMCASLCEAVTGQRHAQSMFRLLRRSNLFIAPLDMQSRWYRYHRCFSETLARRLEDEDPELIRGLHQRAMRWYLQRGLLRDAVHHALASGNIAAAADAIELQVDELLWERGEITELLSWLHALPRAFLLTRPGLCLAHAWALALTGQLESIEEPLLIAEQGLEPSAGSSAATDQLVPLRGTTLGEIAAVRAVSAGLRIDTASLASWSLAAVAHSPDSQFLRGILALSRGRAYDITANVRGAVEAYAEARELSEGTGNVHIQAVATSRLAELWALQGELHHAADIHRRVLRLADEDPKRHAAVGAIAHVGIGSLLYEWNDLRGAAHHFEEGVRLAVAWGHLETLKGAYFGSSRVKFALGADADGWEFLSEAETIARHSNAPRSIVWIHAMQARSSLAKGDRADAIHWTQTSPLHPEREPMRLYTGEYTTLARVLIAQHEHDAALKLLENLLRMATTERWVGLIIEVRVLQALALQDRGAIRASFLPLRKALAVATPEAYMRSFLDEGSPLAHLLNRASADSTMPPHLHTVLAAFNHGTVSADVHSLVRHVVLTQREQEILRHIASGETNGEIAQQLVVTLATVKRHVSNIFDKLAVTSRTQAVVRARERGIL